MYWVLVIVVLAVLIYFGVTWSLTYWSRNGTQQRSAFEELMELGRTILQRKAQADFFKDFYCSFPKARYIGGYLPFSPVLLLRDPELIKQITVKNFDHFTDHSPSLPEDMEPLWGKNLFALKGGRWRNMRTTLSPSFTSSKLKTMFVPINECAQQFVEYFKNNNSELVDIQDAFTRFANDVIASAAFGITCDSLTDRHNEFYIMGKQINVLRGILNNIETFTIMILPTLAKLLGMKMFPQKVSTFFRNVVKTNIESREKNGVVRRDMIHLLMEARNGRLQCEHQKDVSDSRFPVIEDSEKQLKKLLTHDDLTAQALMFFFFNSASTLMCFIVYELAVNPEIQDMLRKEVENTLESCKGSLTYEALSSMKYMDMVISETMRKWPIQSAIDRVCVKPFTINPKNEGEVPIHLKKDAVIWISVFGIHRDPQYYPDPERFNPERFSDENKANINPYAFLPFGSGPRSCLGNRFALLEIKAILFNILSAFEVCLSKKTAVPLNIAKDSFTLNSEDGFWFEMRKLKS